MSRNKYISDNLLVRDGLRELCRRLPPQWTLGAPTLEPRTALTDATVVLTAPDGRSVLIGLMTRRRLEPKDVRSLAGALSETQRLAPLVVMSRYLSEGSRERLRGLDVGYLDLTGNVRLNISEPGLYMETQGASEDPDREERPARSLRGPKAGRVVRALVDQKQPVGVRQLAALTKVDAGYVSRVFTFLDSEALITRVGHGRLDTVDWQALLRRWAKEAPLEARGTPMTYLEPRGISALLARLGASDEQYVVTGGLAAAAFAPVAPTRLATVWIRDAAAAATRLGLRPADSGANVLLLEPNTEGVFDGAEQRDGVWYAAPSQVAVDLLTSPGRGPAEGEELIQWMRENEENWRT